MHLQTISILNFKNIAEATLEFSPKINCLVGNNGMGKTNLLDAVYYLSFTKSFMLPVDSFNIRHNEEYFMIQGSYTKNETTEEVYCGLKRRQKKQFKRNRKEYEKLSDHIGVIPLVLVSPSDTALIGGGSDERRRFVDMVLSQYDKPYLQALIQYNKALTQRNAMLKASPSSADPELMGIFEQQMEQHGRLIFDSRARFINQFVPVFQRYYDAISGRLEEVTIHYQSHASQGELDMQLLASRQRDQLLGFSSKGVHKDDLDFYMGDYLIKKVGSQGQHKSFLIALKLAQFEFLKEICGVKPILLLDDVFDKLDTQRVEQIVNMVAGDDFGQIFLTDTNRNHLEEIVRRQPAHFRLFTVANGTITTHVEP